MYRFTNIFIGYNATEDFRILICAFDREEAQELADAYRFDAGLEGKFEITEPAENTTLMHFDCDYVIA